MSPDIIAHRFFALFVPEVFADFVKLMKLLKDPGHLSLDFHDLPTMMKSTRATAPLTSPRPGRDKD